MSRRKTVKLNLPVVNPLIKQVFRSNVVFCEKMGRAHNWVTDWNRKDEDEKPKPKNLPSPEEAAQMCILLKTTPDKILMHEGKTPEETAKCLEDIETVRKLVEAERAKENAPGQMAEGVMQEDDEDFREAVSLLKKMDKETLRVFVKAARGAVGE